MMRRRGARRAAVVMLLTLGAGAAGALACGRYGEPIRAEEYRLKQQQEREAEQARRRGSTPQERNEPIPAAP